VDGAVVSTGTLYIVATPLGNLGDLSDRARNTLRRVSALAAEDTRRARVLLQQADARPRLLSLHAHSSEGRYRDVLGMLEAGDDVALVTDAGTPAVSDPGAELVRRAREAGAIVVAVPGPSAVAAALSISGLPADRYTFFGFLPRKGPDRRALLEAVAASPWTSVMFEAPTRLAALLGDLAGACGGERPTAVARELTKLHEEVRVGNLAELRGYYDENPPRGEITLVVAGRPQEPAPAIDEELVRARARRLLQEGMSRRDAASAIAAELSVGKRDVYRIVTSL
jgi:16S rRNA (cytidine1402-2'-O)-methyltransferase